MVSDGVAMMSEDKMKMGLQELEEVVLDNEAEDSTGRYSGLIV